MNVALCLYGNLRSFNTVWSTLQKRIVQPYSPDIFGFVWYNTPEMASNKFDSNHPIWNINTPFKKEHVITKNYVGSMIDTINPTAIITEDGSATNTKFYAILNEYKNRKDIKEWVMPLATYKNLWSQEQCVKLKKAHETHNNKQYDVVIMSRWDVVYENEVDLASFNKDSLTIPENFMARRPNDFWIAGNSQSIDIVSSRFSAIKHLIEHEPLPNHPAKFMEQIMNQNNIAYNSLPLPINLLNRSY